MKTKDYIIKQALKTLVNGEIEKGSEGYSLMYLDYEVSWVEVLKWLDEIS